MILLETIAIIPMVITPVLLEIKLDPYLWKKKLNEKLISTLIRGAAFLLLSFFLWLMGYNYFASLGLLVGTFVMFFDFGLNVKRWKELPNPFYRPLDKICREFHGDLWGKYLECTRSDLRQINKRLLTRKQRIIYSLMQFSAKFFYHGGEHTKSPWDRMFQRIPPLGELLFKGIIFGISIWLFLL
jgi:hypothetical protein